jgi:hypothetical protein
MASVSSVPAKKPDVARIVTWSVVGILLLVGIYIYATPTPQSKTAKGKHPGQATTILASADNAILPQDLTAHFPRYSGGKRDPFIPLVASAATSASSQANQGEWLLTGISSINGVPSALVENSSTGESAFLTDGESWRGLKVKSISSDSVVFENTLGQETHLGFSDSGASQAGTSTAGGAPSSSLPSASQIRPLPQPQVGSLPPLPVPAANTVQTGAPPPATAPAPTGQTPASQESPVQQQ